MRRSLSTAALSIFRSVRACALDRELVGEAVALGLPWFVVRGAGQRADLAYRAPERQLLQEDETNRSATMQPPIWSQNDPYRKSRLIRTAEERRPYS
jgi:hypothetical protein